jgi:eukaryotic-like serine/threonine-protein kinase
MTLPTARRHLARGSVIAGKLRIERTIGQGAMGVVFEARDLIRDERVAVKVMAAGIMHDPDLRRRFDREAQAVARLESVHVARVLETTELDDGAPCLVLEYLEGRSLDALLAERGALSPTFAVDCILQALDALAEAHTLGLVHRDFKPANLFLCERPDGTSLVKVLDFGIVKDANAKAKITETGATMGTPAYMSPEQISSGAPVDPRADVWAVGVTLFELITGSLPFAGASIPGTLSRILKDEPPRLTSVRSDAPAVLEHVLLTCLAKDPAARYPDARSLAAALTDARATLPQTTTATRTLRMPPGFSLADALAKTQLGPAAADAPGDPAAPGAMAGAAPADVPPEETAARTRRRAWRRPRVVLLLLAALAFLAGMGFALRERRARLSEPSETSPKALSALPLRGLEDPEPTAEPDPADPRPAADGAPDAWQSPAEAIARARTERDPRVRVLSQANVPAGLHSRWRTRARAFAACNWPPACTNTVTVDMVGPQVTVSSGQGAGECVLPSTFASCVARITHRQQLTPRTMCPRGREPGSCVRQIVLSFE